ncbi:type II toxin-antitoxin system RelE/ParE family toxin [Ciceribacter sp. L1K23]|uniref:type II toxin-antitoxin system RelE/ParE family toxin n=1 Tax=Ciceribacter sp. L1K23 TaxID=2820276 RepID=UPI001B83B6D0|nr:type II toxin-antitoxin system RelE/ParE family toxin [Ciceribacter sp. L1K23]MBR0555628.1 type II toxin-antitoxin system RelE/ParE family toxin [Ciceribacter sp. L1K23]
MSYRLTRRAAEDIRGIYRRGVETFGEVQAETYHLHLEHVFNLLAENPHMARERPEISPPVRIHPAGSHLVIYRVKANGDVLIVAVPNARENWHDHLS